MFRAMKDSTMTDQATPEQLDPAGGARELSPRVADYLVAIGADLTTDAGKRLVARLSGVQNFNTFRGPGWASLTGAQRSESLLEMLEAKGTPITFYDSHSLGDRLRSLQGCAERAGRDGDPIQVLDAKQLADDLARLGFDYAAHLSRQP